MTQTNEKLKKHIFNNIFNFKIPEPPEGYDNWKMHKPPLIKSYPNNSKCLCYVRDHLEVRNTSDLLWGCFQHEEGLIKVVAVAYKKEPKKEEMFIFKLKNRDKWLALSSNSKFKTHKIIFNFIGSDPIPDSVKIEKL